MDCRSLGIVFVTVVIVLAGQVLPASGAEFTWIGDGDPGTNSDDDWDNSLFWHNHDNLFEPGIDDGNVPGAFGLNDVATIDGNFDVFLREDVNPIGELNIAGGASVDNDGFQLELFLGFAALGVTNVSDGGSRLIIRNTGESVDFRSLRLNLESGGQLTLVDGDVGISGLYIESGSTVAGSGTLGNYDASFDTIQNNGLIRASGGTLTITDRFDFTTSSIDIDGDGNGSLEASAASTLIVDRLLEDQTFGGTATVRRLGRLQFNRPWTLSGPNGGVLNLNGADVGGGVFLPGTATVSGATLTSTGTINVNNGTGPNFGTAVFENTLNATAGTTTIAVNANLIINGEATWGAGANLVFNGGASRWTINGSATVNQPAFTPPIFIDVNGSLAVNTSSEWTLPGLMTLDGADVNGAKIAVTGGITAIDGDSTINSAIDFDGGGLAVAAGARLDLESSTRFEPGSNLDVDGSLNLNGTTTFAGPNGITGSGTLRQNANAIVTQPTTISVASYDWDGSSAAVNTTINSGQSLTVNSALTDAHGGLIRVNNATLSINDANGLTIGGEGNLMLEGAAPVLNGTQVTAVSGSEITVSSSDALINTDLILESSSSVRMLTDGSRLMLGGMTRFNGGEIVETNASTVVFDGTAIVSSSLSEVDVTTVEFAGIVNWSDGGLQAATIDHTHGGQFNFTGGTLVVKTFEGDLTQDGGTLSPGGAPGTTTINGNYSINAGIVAIHHFDMLTIEGTAMLAGTLDVSLVTGLTPSAGDTFEILTAAAVQDTFDVENFPTLAGLDWHIMYGPTSIVLSVVTSGLPGDYNDDGVVNAADYVVWRNHEGTPFDLPNRDPDAMGTIDDGDYQFWVDNFGNTSGSASSIPQSAIRIPRFAVPEPRSLFLILAFALQFPFGRRGSTPCAVI